MNNEIKVIKEIGKEIIKMEKENKNYIENPTQMSKYNYAKGFFCKYIKENHGKLKTELSQSNLNAGLTVTINLVDLIDVDLRSFINILKFASAVTFDATKTGQVCISLTIPNVYTKE